MEKQCRVCEGLLGPLELGQVLHALCAWAGPDDWRALEPWVSGMRGGVSMGND